MKDKAEQIFEKLASFLKKYKLPIAISVGLTGYNIANGNVAKLSAESKQRALAKKLNERTF